MKTTIITNGGAFSIINPTQDQIARFAYQRILAEKTERFVKDNGRRAECQTAGCQMVGMKCPLSWCERVYLQIRKELAKTE